MTHPWQGPSLPQTGELVGVNFPPKADIPVMPMDLIDLHDIKIALFILETVSSYTITGQHNLTQVVYLRPDERLQGIQ